MELLKERHFPEDIKLLLPQQLEILAEEIRHLIIDTVSHNGGHLASNLGTVELTLALYRVFDFPEDKLFWDVGHQAYTHKILSGRLRDFHTLRQRGGLTGFPNRKESQFDSFGVGHASTALSAALGFAIARDLDGSSRKIIAVIGDGALTGGEAFEALNNIGDLQKDMLIILNDNEMSISKNVGAMSTYLSRVRSYPEYNRLKKDFGKMLSSLPKIGSRVFKTAEFLKDSVRNACVAGALFEEMGLSYFGPVDGHDFAELIPMLQRVSEIKGPVLLHVVTKKGKGYEPAENAPSKFHGIGKFNVEDGMAPSSGKADVASYTQVFGKTVAEIGDIDSAAVTITAAMADGTGLKEFALRYPGRFFDVGIAEEHALTMAAGLAAAGKKPFIALYSTFAQRGYDQIIHDICLQKLPVRLCLDRAGLVGEDGPTHHGVFDFSFLRQIPNMTVMAPKDEHELRAMLYFMHAFEGPIAVRYPRGKATGVKERKDNIEYGKGEILRQGDDVLFLAVGTMVYPALAAAKMLGENGISCCVVNMRFIKPLDEALLKILLPGKKCLVTAEENVLAGGFGSAVLEYLAQSGAVIPKICRFGIGDSFVGHGTRVQLLEEQGLTAEKMATRIEDLCRA